MAATDMPAAAQPEVEALGLAAAAAAAAAAADAARAAGLEGASLLPSSEVLPAAASAQSAEAGTREAARATAAAPGHRLAAALVQLHQPSAAPAAPPWPAAP